MHLYEAEIKKLMSNNGIIVPTGILLHKKDSNISATINNILHNQAPMDQWMVKAQVLSSGRTKAGGVIKSTREKLHNTVISLFNKKIKFKQSNDKEIEAIYIEECIEYTQEFYLSFNIINDCIHLVINKEGGIEIENSDLKKNTFTLSIDQCWNKEHDKQICNFLEINPINVGVFQQLYNFFHYYDLQLLEINPLALTKNNEIKILDAKATMDDNAIYRQRKNLDILKVKKYEINSHITNHQLDNYIPLDGDIACIVNGAGLAMATCDAISLHGGKAANFLDLGGGTSIEEMNTLLWQKIFYKNAEKVVLFNIFGGIVNCELIAQAIIKNIEALISHKLQIPYIIARIQGNGSKIAKEILSDLKNHNIIFAADFKEAVKQAIFYSKLKH